MWSRWLSLSSLLLGLAFPLLSAVTHLPNFLVANHDVGDLPLRLAVVVGANPRRDEDDAAAGRRDGRPTPDEAQGDHADHDKEHEGDASEDLITLHDVLHF